MLQHKITTSTIFIVARSREKNCADRAKHLLDEMGRLYNEGDEDLVPDALTFGAIINAVSRLCCKKSCI